MRTRALWTFAAVGICILVTTLLAAAPGEKPTSAWEYKFVTYEAPHDPAEGDSNEANAQGSKGWELVSATVDSNNKYVLYYKRAQ